MKPLLGKARWDPQPTAPADVLLASDGRRRFTSRAVARATALAGDGPVAVMTIARVYGTSLGLPHPGLLPTKEEMEERLGWVEDAIRRLEGEGVAADGQIASTRRPVRSIVRTARTRKVRIVVMDASTSTRGRRLIEGDPARSITRSLRRRGIEVEIVPATTER